MSILLGYDFLGLIHFYIAIIIPNSSHSEKSVRPMLLTDFICRLKEISNPKLLKGFPYHSARKKR